VLPWAAGAMILFTNRRIKRMIFGAPKRRRRRPRVTRYRKTVRRVRRKVTRRPVVRSVNTRTKGRGYPAPGGGYIPYKYNKDGTLKKAWQVGGTLAARNRMRRLRKNR